MFKKGEIYLAKLNPKKGNEVGKLRPVLIYQTDMLNDIIHPTTTILPLSTHLIDDSYPLRLRIQKMRIAFKPATKRAEHPATFWEIFSVGPF